MPNAQIAANYQQLEGSERHPSPGAVLEGPADPKEKFNVTISLRRRPDGLPIPGPEAFGPGSAPRTPMSDAEFASKYGASDSDIAQVTKFIKDSGLTLVESNAARRTVVASGTVAQMSKTFGVELGKYTANANRHKMNGGTTPETYRGRDGFINIPKNLSDIVVGVFGLDNRNITKRNGGDPPNTATITLPEIKKLYNFPTNSAAGQTIGIFAGTGYSLNDIQKFFASTPMAGYAQPTVTDISVDGTTNPGSDPYGETTQDIDIAAACGEGAAIAVYLNAGGQQGWVDTIHRVAHPSAGDPHCSVLSSSYYISNGDDSATLTAEGITTAFINAVSAAFQDAALQGITICIASGDTGSNSKVSDGKAHVQYPGSDPNVLAVGGTTVGNISGTNFDEYVWNDTLPSPPFSPNTQVATGGGISDYFALPSYQNGWGVPHSVNAGNRVGRGVPDVSANASYNSGYSGLYLNYPNTMVGNGTSAAAPLWAGFIAVLNAALGYNIGFANPTLYGLGSSPFRAIPTPTGGGPANNGVNGTPGYPVQAGWDACTGLGSVNGVNILNAFWGIAMPPALAVLNGTLNMTWKGVRGDWGIYASHYPWVPQTLITGVGTSAGPAMAEFNGKLYMAWKGQANDQGIYWSTSSNGTTWAAQQQVAGVGTSTGPQLAVFNGKLYMAWKGEYNDPGIYYSELGTTGTWAAQQRISGVGTSVGPALAVFNGLLYAVWKGEYADPGIYYSHAAIPSSSTSPLTWAPQQQVAGVGTSGIVSIAVYNSKLYAAWKGEFTDERLWWSSATGNSSGVLTWAPQQQIPGVASSIGPSICVLGNNLFAAWKGELGDDRIWYSQFNGTTWTAQQAVPGAGTSPNMATMTTNPDISTAKSLDTAVMQPGAKVKA